MRTVLVHLRTATKVEVEHFLGQTYPRQKGPPWICAVGDDACLYINTCDELVEAPEIIARLHKELGGEPSVSVSADVSGRHPGEMQVREFVSKLLSAFDGLAQDDWTDGFWTLSEIRSERKKPSSLSGRAEGHTFFDHHYPWHLCRPKMTGDPGSEVG